MSPPLNLVINLERSTKRLADMQAQFGACGADFERIEAVDARKLPESVRDIHVSADPMRVFDLATIACFLSHREAWKTLSDSDHEVGIVFEDDVVFGESAGQFFADAKWFPDQIDIVKLETFNKVAVFKTSSLHQVGPYRLHSLQSTHLGGAAYAMRRELAGKLVKQTERFQWPVDKYLFDTRCLLNAPLKVAQVEPAPFTQSFLMPGQKQSDQSEIKAMRDANAPKGMRRFLVRQGRSVRKRYLLLARPFFKLTGRQVRKISFNHPPLVSTISGISR